MTSLKVAVKITSLSMPVTVRIIEKLQCTSKDMVSPSFIMKEGIGLLVCILVFLFNDSNCKDEFFLPFEVLLAYPARVVSPEMNAVPFIILIEALLVGPKICSPDFVTQLVNVAKKQAQMVIKSTFVTVVNFIRNRTINGMYEQGWKN